jgi:hypothetical protein
MMRINQKVKIVCLVLILFIIKCIPLWAQGTFRYKVDVAKIDTSGVYKIELKDNLVAKSKENLHDIRLLNHKGKFIAYALSSNLFIDNPESFIEFPEVNSNASTDTSTIYIADNKSRLTISQLWIKLKNTEVNRSVNLSGSEDLKRWFAIKEDISLEEANSARKTEYEQLLSFPASNYRYFRIQINGKNKAPVKITGSGIYMSTQNRPEYTKLPALKFSSKDTNKVSSVFIHFDEPYRVNQLHLEISAPKYYTRHISAYDTGNKTANKICDTTISSAGSQDIFLSAKTAQIRIDISNVDDNRLEIKAINAFQQKQYIISYLETGNDYYILTGDSAAGDVNYDLSFLKYKPYNQLPVINHSAVYKNPDYTTNRRSAKPDRTLLIWVAIIAVLILLSFLTWKMVREINQKQTGDQHNP